MVLNMYRQLLLAAIYSLSAAKSAPSCKTAPSSIPAATWSQLNSTVSGALLSTAAIGVPGGICHPQQPNYNESLCPIIQAEWFTTWEPITSHPVHNGYQNYNNDSCWPFTNLGLECNPLKGYPTYVVNATSVSQVAAAVNFAREQNVRLIVKTTGHDFRGRSVGPNSLSIWLKHFTGLKLHTSFIPAGKCSYGSGEPAITWAPGENALSRQAFAHKNGVIINVGGGPSVGAGYAFGGGHSLISSVHGLSADNILEVNIVTPDGKLVTANDCQNKDLFWAVRGGGGGTFGVVVNMTERVFPNAPAAVVDVHVLGIDPSNTSTFYNAAAAFLAHYPMIADSGLTSYSFLVQGNDTRPPAWDAAFMGLNKTIGEMTAILAPLIKQLNSTYKGEIVINTNGSTHEHFYNYWSRDLDDTGRNTPIGVDLKISSRLLDKTALTRPNMPQLLQGIKSLSASFFMVSGPGVHRHAADFNSVSPSWRKSYIHLLLGSGWLFGNQELESSATDSLTVSRNILTEMVPNGGAYLNEANAHEPNFQEVFWGTNYPRLLRIKKQVDPDNVFWCKSCVGSEGIDVVNDLVCKL